MIMKNDSVPRGGFNGGERSQRVTLERVCIKNFALNDRLELTITITEREYFYKLSRCAFFCRLLLASRLISRQLQIIRAQREV